MACRIRLYQKQCELQVRPSSLRAQMQASLVSVSSQLSPFDQVEHTVIVRPGMLLTF